MRWTELKPRAILHLTCLRKPLDSLGFILFFSSCHYFILHMFTVVTRVPRGRRG